VFDPFDGRQRRGIDLVETAAEPGERPHVGVNRRPAQILEKVIVEMVPVERRQSRTDLVEIREVVVDKMREGLRWVH